MLDTLVCKKTKRLISVSAANHLLLSNSVSSNPVKELPPDLVVYSGSTLFSFTDLRDKILIEHPDSA